MSTNLVATKHYDAVIRVGFNQYRCQLWGLGKVQVQVISFIEVEHKSDPSDDDDDDCCDYDLNDDDIGTSDQLHKEWSCIQEAWAAWQLSFPSHWLTLPSGLL